MKRSSTLGCVSGLSRQFDKNFSLKMFEKASYSRQFDLQVKYAFDNRLMPSIPIYLCIGQEFTSAALSMVLQDFMIFGQHRAHGLYLSFGGDPEALRDELLGLPTGCSRGMSGSNAIQAPEVNMFGHSGLMGEQVPIAVGAALGSKRPVLTIMGDASAEEDYIYPSLGYAATHRLPVLFVCEDNGLSILTPIEVRRNWSIVSVAQSMGIPSVDITDDPWLIAHHARQFRENLPALINIQTVRHFWHAGTGQDGEPDWNRYELVKEEMKQLNLSLEVEDIERNTMQRAKKIWEKIQQRQ